VVDTALLLLSLLAEKPPARAVRVAFLADEIDEHRGLMDQMDQIDDPESVVVLYVDLRAAGSTPQSLPGLEGAYQSPAAP